MKLKGVIDKSETTNFTNAQHERLYSTFDLFTVASDQSYSIKLQKIIFCNDKIVFIKASVYKHNIFGKFDCFSIF